MPFIPPAKDVAIDERLNNILAKRRSLDKSEVKKDLLQILIETKEKYPNEYADGNIKSDMTLFMYVLRSI